jgi:hypothetical protein
LSGWIKLDKQLPESIRFRRVVRAVREKSNALRNATPELAVTAVLGALMRLWAYADSHIDDTNLLGVTLDEIDEIVGIDGFAHALPADWLQVVDPDHVQLPDFVQHNGSSAKQRSKNAQRQANFRHRKKAATITPRNANSNALPSRSNDARPDQTTTDQEKKDSVEPLSPVIEFSSSPPAKAGRSAAQIEAQAIEIPKDWQPNDVNREWLVESGMTVPDMAKVIGEFVRYWRTTKLRKSPFNWQRTFLSNPMVKKAVASAITGASNGATQRHGQKGGETPYQRAERKHREWAESHGVSV